MYGTKKTAGDKGDLNTMDDGLASYPEGITTLQAAVFSKVQEGFETFCFALQSLTVSTSTTWTIMRFTTHRTPASQVQKKWKNRKNTALVKMSLF